MSSNLSDRLWQALVLTMQVRFVRNGDKTIAANSVVSYKTSLKVSAVRPYTQTIEALYNVNFLE